MTLACVALAGCSPDYDWREIRSLGGEYRVQLPGKPATMTRQIHLEGLTVDMTMQGAKVGENAFTVALVQLPESASSPERVLLAMREQMLRNIGAPASTPPQDARVDLINVDGRKLGAIDAQAVSAKGSGNHGDLELRARFAAWHGHVLQIVAVGPALDPEQASHFLDSLRLLQR